MATQPQHEQIGGAPYRIADAYVWAAIYYLDSPTDFRECLPRRRSKKVGRAAIVGFGLVLAVVAVVAGLAALSRALLLG
jgi:hypothetical protein